MDCPAVKLPALVPVLIILLLPSISAQNSVTAGIDDRYHGSFVISMDFTSEIKSIYDSDSSGYLEHGEIQQMLRDRGPHLNFTTVLDWYYFLENLTLDSRSPLVFSRTIREKYPYPMPVNGTTTYILRMNYTFYLNGTSDHVMRFHHPGFHGKLSVKFPDGVVILDTNLKDARINGNSVQGEFSNMAIVRFREMNYYWMGFGAYALIGIISALFIVMARWLTGGRTRGIKLLIRSIVRNIVALIIVLTLLFYILWVLGPPPSVRIGGISTYMTRFQIIQYYHLDRPWYDQFIRWWYLLLTGELAHAATWGSKIPPISQAAMNSLAIFVVGTAASYIISIYLGVRRDSANNLDPLAALFLAIYSVPTFYAAYLIAHTL